MGCCEHHDRLGSKLHAAEYTAGDCGSLRLKTVEQMVPGTATSAPMIVQDAARAGPGAVPYYMPEHVNKPEAGRVLIGFGRPEYCCFNCPTLLAKLGVAQ